MGKNIFENRNKGNSNGGTNNQPFGSAAYKDNVQEANSDLTFKFAPVYDKSYEYASYQSIKDKIIDQLQRDWNYYSTGEALKAVIEMQSDFNSVMSTPDEEDSEFRPSEMALKIRYMLRERRFNDEMVSIYQLIIDEFCTTEMVMTIMSHPEFDDRIENNPVELLETIEEAMTLPEMDQDDFDMMTSTINQWMAFKQADEDDDEFLKNQERYVEVMESIMGSDYWDKCVMSKINYEFEFEPDNRDKLMKIGFGI